MAELHLWHQIHDKVVTAIYPHRRRLQHSVSIDHCVVECSVHMSVSFVLTTMTSDQSSSNVMIAARRL